MSRRRIADLPGGKPLRRAAADGGEDGGSSLASMPFEMLILRTALARVADESAQ
jgi:hypothetical protein